MLYSDSLVLTEKTPYSLQKFIVNICSPFYVYCYHPRLFKSYFQLKLDPRDFFIRIVWSCFIGARPLRALFD